MAFFTERIRGVMSVINALMLIVSGTIIPLSLFPDLIQKITYLFPFRMYVYVPTQIILNVLSIKFVLINISIGVSWIIILSRLSSYLWRKGIHRVEANI